MTPSLKLFILFSVSRDRHFPLLKVIFERLLSLIQHALIISRTFEVKFFSGLNSFDRCKCIISSRALLFVLIRSVEILNQMHT